MVFSLKKSSASSATANVIDGYLILSLPQASEPVVWRMALDKIDTAAFEVKHDKESGAAKLILKPKKGTAEIIAPFDNKEDAVKALMAASGALQNARPSSAIEAAPTPKTKTTIKKQAAPPQAKPQAANNNNGNAQKWIITLLLAVIVIGSYLYLMSLIPDTTTEFAGQASSTDQTNLQPQEKTGVSVDADEYLGGL